MKHPAIDRLVFKRQAIGVVGRFQTGWSTRKIARYYGLSAAGVEHLIRLYGFPARRKR